MRVVLGVLWVVIWMLAGTTHAQVNKALLQPAFTASPGDLLAAANAAPAGDWSVVLLRQEYRITFDDQGRATSRWRLVAVIRSQAGVDEWGTISRSWQPFYQDKPSVRARVIEPNGKVTELDPSLIHDAPAVETSPSVFSDQRSLEAPLPRLQIGAVIEQEIITTDRAPLLSAGTVETLLVGGELPIMSASYVLSAPASRKAKVVERGLTTTTKPRHEIVAGRETWTYELGASVPTSEWEAFVPSDVVQFPYVGIATGPSWNAVARDYRKILDRRLADGRVTLPASLPRTPTIETVRAIVAWLHQQVRYTGIEFGEASIVPWPPAETLRRGFGDCKDKATLLVALLRDAGIRADLALLSTGPGVDIDPKLPGMGVFDHAIVRAQVAGHDVWIDATEDLVVVGRLPTRDQARRVLIVADDTRDLTSTPKPTAQETVVRETRTFELAETGGSRVTEVSREGGVYEVEMRSWIRDSRADDVRKELESYADTEYVAKALEKYTTTSPTDLSTPFEVTVVASQASRGYSGRDRIDVYLFPRDVLAKLPSILTQNVDAKAEPRKRDFELYTPHTYEIENRLIVPPGFTPPTPAAEQTRTLGTMTLTQRQRLDGQTLVVTYTFVTGKPRLTPAELATVRTALERVQKEENHVVFEHTGWALADRGKPKEALAEIERLIALHPKEAIHHTQLAFVLIRAGAGAAARVAARKAVQLEPTNADAHVILGWVLRFDTLGREFGFDHDRAGAIAALNKARKLDPTHVGAASDLATVLERDDEGQRFGERADLKAAAEGWRAAYELDKTEEHAQGYLRALLFSGNAAAAETFARTLDHDDVRDSLLVSAVALVKGVPSAINEAGTLRTGRARSTLIDGAASVMMMMRKYDVARALFAETGSMKAGTVQATMINGIQRVDRKSGPIRGARGVVDELFLGLFLDPAATHIFWDARTQDEFGSGTTPLPPIFAQVRQMGTGFIRDLAASELKVRITGAKDGPWRVDADAYGKHFITYVALDRGVAKMIGTDDPSGQVGLGRHALRLMARRDEAGARAVLDWARSDLDARKLVEDDWFPFRRLWRAGAPTDKDSIMLAAAVLAAGTEQTISIPLLIRCATKVVDARKSCDMVLTYAYSTEERHKELVAHTEAWEQRDSGVPLKIARQFRAHALISLRRFDEAQKLIEALLVSNPLDLDAARVSVDLSLARGQTTDAAQKLAAITERADASPNDKNNLAWLHAAERSHLPEALTLAQTAVRDAKDAPHIVNTLAVILAEMGDLGAARTEGWRSMEIAHRTIPSGADWYLIGRLYEQLGLRADAIAAYKRIPADKRSSIMASSYVLGRSRLEKLGTK